MSHLIEKTDDAAKWQKTSLESFEALWTERAISLDISKALSAESKKLQRALSYFSNSLPQFTGEL